LKAKKALKALTVGDRLTVIATDPGAMKDFHHFCEATGDTLESVTEDDGVLTFVINKAE
jgi:tRNA 2-thiouridine synthesizing protein A